MNCDRLAREAVRIYNLITGQEMTEGDARQFMLALNLAQEIPPVVEEGDCTGSADSCGESY